MDVSSLEMRDYLLGDLMQSYVEQYKLHDRIGDLSIWTQFKRKIGVDHSATWLQTEYREKYLQHADIDVPDDGAVLQEGVHYTWCNDIRHGLEERGFAVRRDFSMVDDKFPIGSGYGLAMASHNQSHSDTDSGASNSSVASHTTASSVGGNSSRPRTKKKTITPHERMTQIKKNLEKLKKRQHLRRRSSARQ